MRRIVSCGTMALTVALLAATPLLTQGPRSREGRLKAGDVAPDFSLDTYNRKQTITLSSFRREKPVVLIFGSYT